MTSGIPRKTIAKFRKKIRKRARYNSKWKKENGGVIYVPTKYIGRFVKIEILEE